ncbi:MAG: hypothetical protein KAX55_01470 [Propionivibrio sp.]|nr:hypothetical protein [Propionivibrio sp.]
MAEQTVAAQDRARYEIERQNEQGDWEGIANTDDLKLACDLVHDTYRRVRDRETGLIVPASVVETNARAKQAA